MMIIRRACAAAIVGMLAIACKDNTGPPIGGPVTLIAVSVTDQMAVFGEALTAPPKVGVFDANGKGVAHAVVTFSIARGAAAPELVAVETDAVGLAILRTLAVPKKFGTIIVTATMGDLPPAVFRITAVAPDAGMSAFSVTDPPGDTLPPTSPGAPRAIDVLSATGMFKRDTLVITLSFAAPVAHIADQAANSVAGVFELDLDENPATGTLPISNSFGASANIGVDRTIILAGSNRRAVLVTDGATQSSIDAEFTGSVVIVRVPMHLLGGDDGNFTFAGVIGTSDRPTDFFPNAGNSPVRFSSAVTLQSGADKLTRAMPAPGRGRVDGGYAEWAPSGRRGRDHGHFLNEGLADSPDDKPDNQEIQEDARKVSYSECDGAYIERSLPPGAGWRSCPDNRHDEIVHDRLDHLSERRSHHHRQGEGQNVFLQDERLEFT